MKNEIADYLSLHGPMASGELAEGLATQLSISPVAARKRIQRREAPVRTVKLSLPKGAQFLYVEHQYGSPAFWERLSAALMDGNGAYARAIRALNARGGLIPERHFSAAAGTSGGQRQVSGEEVVKRLVAAELLQEIEMPDLGPCVAFARGGEHLDEKLPAIRARLIAEAVLLQAIEGWAAKLGLGSFHSFKLRPDRYGEQPTVGPFTWDLSVPSYLGR